MNSASKKIVSLVMMILIIVGVCSAFVCLLHDCCAIDLEHSHQCCLCDDHADECSSHTHSVEHKCHDAELLDAKWTPQERTELNHYFVACIFIYNLLSTCVDEPSWEVWRCEVFIDSYVPSAGLLRAPPALRV